MAQQVVPVLAGERNAGDDPLARVEICVDIELLAIVQDQSAEAIPETKRLENPTMYGTCEPSAEHSPQTRAQPRHDLGQPAPLRLGRVLLAPSLLTLLLTPLLSCALVIAQSVAAPGIGVAHATCIVVASTATFIAAGALALRTAPTFAGIASTGPARVVVAIAAAFAFSLPADPVERFPYSRAVALAGPALGGPARAAWG
ncbi:hypothetical protein, partial [Streptomyces sp. 8K308]|uniref:hypothetical protein n=1 Tax=Streptomyces sp. 8K308 TaxID=2530388 RepID=UPI001A9E518B